MSDINSWSKKWKGQHAQFVINNYTDEDIARMDKLHSMKSVILMSAQTEIGEEKGTPHIQGYIKFSNSCPDWHKKVGARSAFKAAHENSFTYANKVETWDGKHRWTKGTPPQKSRKRKSPEEEFEEEQLRKKARLLRLYDNVVWKDWQQDILDLLYTPPCARTIHWFYDPDGNSGKSFLTRYLGLRNRAWIVNGMSGDMAMMLYNEMLMTPEVDCLIIDVPRAQGNRICYSMFEKVSDAVVTSTKYNSRKYYLDIVHKIIFSNEMPDFEKMSKDRFNVRVIGGKPFDESNYFE